MSPFAILDQECHGVDAILMIVEEQAEADDRRRARM